MLGIPYFIRIFYCKLWVKKSPLGAFVILQHTKIQIWIEKKMFDARLELGWEYLFSFPVNILLHVFLLYTSTALNYVVLIPFTLNWEMAQLSSLCYVYKKWLQLHQAETSMDSSMWVSWQQYRSGFPLFSSGILFWLSSQAHSHGISL